MFYKQKLKHSYHFFANAHEISHKSNIIRRNGYTWKCLRKMRRGNELKKKKRKILSENIFKDKPLSLLWSLLWKYWLIFISEIIYCDNIYSLPKAGKLLKSHIYQFLFCENACLWIIELGVKYEWNQINSISSRNARHVLSNLLLWKCAVLNWLHSYKVCRYEMK